LGKARDEFGVQVDQDGAAVVSEYGRRSDDLEPMFMTEDQLVEHRLKQLEQATSGFRNAERRVDLLEIAVSRFETGQAEIRTEAATRDEHTRGSLARLHERLDELAADEHRDQGARAARVQIARIVAATFAAITAIVAAVVGVVALVMGGF
jgi:hypothetical protein